MTCRYFNDSGSEGDDGLEGEGEEAVKERIAKEFRWTETNEETVEEEEGDDDPLDAFMASIEVRNTHRL